MDLLLEYYEAMFEYKREDGVVQVCAGFIKDTAEGAKEYALEQALALERTVERIAVYKCVRVELLNVALEKL